MSRSRLEAQKPLIRELYLSGISTKAIAKQIGGCTYGAIQWIVRDIMRRPADAISLAKPPRSMKPSATRARARGIVRRALGQTGETVWGKQIHVHHRDGDCTNNDPSNLEVLSASTHIRLHQQRRGRRQPRRVGMCLTCGHWFVQKSAYGAPKLTCSRSCGAARAYLR